MKKLLATTAMIALLGAPAWAQSTTTGPGADLTIAQMPVADVIGDPVYITAADGAEQVGVAIDVLLAANGVIAGVLVDTSAVPDLTPKVIAVDAQILSSTTDPDTSEQILVLDGVDKPSIEVTSAYDEQATTDAGFVRLSQLESSPATGGDASPDATAEATPPTEAPAGDLTEAPAGEVTDVPQTFIAVAPTDVSPEELETAEVFDANDEPVSGVSDVVVTDTGVVEDVVFKVGGFLGFGAKSVAVPVEEVQIMRDPAGEELRVYVNAAKDELKELPAFEG
ncbi:MAG: PRC-barrel domain-containing protein [Pseudomonadota bacterium]